jgi:glycosyl transferase family 25
MNIYFINIDSRTERKKFIEQQIKKLDLKAERVSAITPDDINIDEFKKKYVVNISPPELCCSLSHELIWKKIISENNKYGIVLEDDVLLSKHLKTFISMIETSKNNFDLLRIETRLEKVRYAAPKFTLSKHFKARKIHDDVAGTAAYIISKSYCEKLLQYPNRFKLALDQVLFYKKSHGELYGNFLQIFPALAIPLDISLSQIDVDANKIVKSDIALMRSERKPRSLSKHSLSKKIGREIKRLIIQVAIFPKVLFYSLSRKKSFLKHNIYFSE